MNGATELSAGVVPGCDKAGATTVLAKRGALCEYCTEKSKCD